MSSSDGSPPALREARVRANGVEFAYLEAGEGPLALCLHGFPDSASTWRHLLPVLARAGFRAVAPYMRGYAPTGLAPDGAYQLGALVADAVALHEALGGDERAVLIGHDWGAETAYGAAALAPERWRRLVTLAVPPLALDEQLFGDYDQLRRFFYLFFFETPQLGLGRVRGRNGLPRPAVGGLVARLRRRRGAAQREALPARARPPRGRAGLLPRRRAGPTRAGRPTPSPPSTPRCCARRPSPRCTCTARATAASTSRSRPTRPRHLAPGSHMEIVEAAGHFLHLEQPATINERIAAWVTS